MAVKKKNPAAVSLGRKGGKKGGPARAAKLTAAERSDSARKAVRARWAKAKPAAPASSGAKTKKVSAALPVKTPHVDASKKALLLSLKRIKEAKNDAEVRRLARELHRIIFRRQYQGDDE